MSGHVVGECQWNKINQKAWKSDQIWQRYISFLLEHYRWIRNFFAKLSKSQVIWKLETWGKHHCLGFLLLFLTIRARKRNLGVESTLRPKIAPPSKKFFQSSVKKIFGWWPHLGKRQSCRGMSEEQNKSNISWIGLNLAEIYWFIAYTMSNVFGLIDARPSKPLDELRSSRPNTKG